MPQINVREVSIGYRGPNLLDGVSCRIEPGEKIGLLGRNGAGKTTFMRLLVGKEHPDKGSIEFQAGTKVALLTQDVPADVQGDVASVILSGYDERVSDHDEEWKRNRDLEQILSTMQLDGSASFEPLSTGMKRRVLLARALVGKPDVLLLDEPTNHLDIDSITWLETFLVNLDCTLLFVTHDRAFLTKLATRILEIDRGRLFDWACDYPTFLKRKEAALEAEEKQNALFDKKLAAEEVWVRTGIKARRTRNEGRVRALERLRLERQKRRQQVGNVKLQIEVGSKSGTLVAELDDAGFGYDGKAIIEHVSLAIFRGDKVGILGRNGAGKSTLLKGILGELPILSGKRRLGTNLQIAYFDQNRQKLDENQTAEENVGQGRPMITLNGTSKHVIGYLQDFLFSPEEARSPIKTFSGGQRNRLLLAKLFTAPANLLVLDEPTNDLDSETLELLEEKLVEYQGSVLVVSHDRDFLDHVVTSTLVLDGGKVQEYDGGYSDWVRQRDAANELLTAATDSKQKSEKKPSAAGSKHAVEEVTTSTAGTITPKKLTFKEQRELESLPATIEKLEEQLAKLHEEIAQPAFYKQPAEQITATQRTIAELEATISTSYSRWEELESRR